MRETPEPRDDVAMINGKADIAGGELAVQLNAIALVIDGFRMYEGHTEEQRERGIDLFYMARIYGLPGVTAGLRIGGKHIGGATKSIARKLIKQQHQRQAAHRLLQPVIEFTTHRCLMQA